jgi:hypothetical protein
MTIVMFAPDGTFFREAPCASVSATAIGVR